MSGIGRTRKKRKLNAEINVVPYIDVTMVLLIIFMVTAPMLTQGIDIDLPQTSAEPVSTEDDEPLIVSVDKKGAYYINVGGEDETTPISAQEVADRVGKVLSVKPDKLLLVRGDRDVNYDAVIQLMVLLKGAGASSVGLVTE
ncbi:Tol biopolymer transport system, TolR protein [Marinobacterium lacunae]|uniref:Tol-Pal system protein TolR n=1 Tax=Marinobacterium lacunae TaxID=1232683 RepID=A0A081FU52_9GAMM|nr:protein TolR [Marinobacterium lacunae]KEA62057.1 Tol biopolymer transport system, TolR protein [Marinobacterium lacunae]MBR9883029.1 protein TolR [Oceanospirillales bacterium]